MKIVRNKAYYEQFGRIIENSKRQLHSLQLEAQAWKIVYLVTKKIGLGLCDLSLYALKRNEKAVQNGLDIAADMMTWLMNEQIILDHHRQKNGES